MVTKLIGLYGDLSKRTPLATDKLVVEIGNSHIACMLKGAQSGQMDGFEIFETATNNHDWNDVFYEVKANSNILTHSFAHTLVYFNQQYATVIPAEKFSVTAAENYLSLLFGDAKNEVVKWDTMINNAELMNVYRVKNKLIDLIGRTFVLVSTRHAYSSLLEEVDMAKHQYDYAFLKIQVYLKHFNLALFKNGALQLVQSFGYQSPEDMLYHIMNIYKQLDINATLAIANVSGFIEINSRHHHLLQKAFASIHFDDMNPDGVFKGVASDYPAHYFTPFRKLIE